MWEGKHLKDYKQHRILESAKQRYVSLCTPMQSVKCSSPCSLTLIAELKCYKRRRGGAGLCPFPFSGNLELTMRDANAPHVVSLHLMGHNYW